MTNSELTKLLNTVETPSYVFDTDEFYERTKYIKSVFGNNVNLCFSIKANPFLLNSLPDEFSNIEVCSPGELTICEKSSVDMQKVIYSGINKGKADIEKALKLNVATFTAESNLHIELINSLAIKHNKKVPLLIRLSSDNQFGIDEKALKQIIANRQEYKGIEIVGIHYFSGTQKKQANTIDKELDYLLSVIDTIKQDYDFDIKKLEYGTGLAVEYFSDTAEETEKERLLAISDKIKEVANKVNLTVEMGRFFAAPCGYYFSKVVDTKTNNDISYAIIDGGLHQVKYDGQIQGMQIPVIHHIGNKTGEAKRWTICGSLCTVSDVIARNVELQNLQIDDVLVFKRTGAYSAMEGMAIFLSREMPRIAIYSKKEGIKILRDFINTDIFNTQ